jgi:cellulose synthase/poly-beta-1,6-N-acetylglucosamine synthase-like glycosyltransferase
MQDIPDEEFEIVVVLDADNLMAADFLAQINQAYNAGYKVIQGHRVAKNENTMFAILDGASEEINNHIFRRGHRNLGLSSALIGSGMAFNFSLYKENMVHTMEFAGEDKELELILLRQGIKFHYLPKAYVYDEKIQQAEAFGNQRRRWLAAQFSSFFRYIGPGLAQLFTKGNVDFFDKVYQMIQPPRSLLIGLPTLLFIIYAGIAVVSPQQNTLMLSWNIWILLLLLTLITLLISLPKRFYNHKTLKALASLPKGIFLMIKALLFSKGASKKFIHTRHGVDE